MKYRIHERGSIFTVQKKEKGKWHSIKSFKYFKIAFDFMRKQYLREGAGK